MMSEDREIEELLRRKALQTWQRARKRLEEQAKKDITREDVVEKLKKIVKGSRAEEIIEKAMNIYGDNAIRVFRELVRLYETGKVRELMDYELYQVLERLGMHIPIETRIRIVKHGSESSISDILS